MFGRLLPTNFWSYATKKEPAWVQGYMYMYVRPDHFP